MESDDYQNQFTFIDSRHSKEDQRKKSRSHVTAQHYRRKRYNARRQFVESSHHSQEKATEGFTEVDQQEELEIQRNGVCPKTKSTTVRANSKTGRSICRLPTIQLNNSRSDPFSSYPIPSTPEIHILVDHYCHVIPSLMHKHWSRAVRRPRSAWGLFDLYRRDKLSFLGMLHHASHHLASMRGCNGAVQSVRFKQEALQAVNARLSDLKGGPLDDGTIVAVGLLANGERLWGDRQTAMVHWTMLKRMILERGGFRSMQENPVMHTKLLWSFIALSWPTVSSKSSFQPPYVDMEGFVESIAGLKEVMLAGSPKTAFRMCCDEFTQFMTNRKEQHLQYRRDGEQFQGLLSDQMWSVLARVDNEYAHPDKRQALANCQMASLMYLNLVVADHGERSEVTRGFFTGIVETVQDDADDSALTAEHLLWTLLSTINQQHHYERCWKLSRMVGIVKNASLTAWNEIEELLRLFLRAPSSGDETQKKLRLWDSRRFTEELILLKLDS